MDLGCGLFKVSAGGGFGFVPISGFVFFLRRRWRMWVCTGGGCGFVPVVGLGL